ncbi:MAG: ABC transporter substrate-binding protein [Bacteroides sp.]|nr:ABC transporter substrate-binding protein [Prevotella sp.]MCM1407649.1 ABC transporter substrate-binding protein [Treponema brennaborense]MCM1469201.1 ABC transporter substrate-binding protein [Bacteroides sp.]
MKKNFGLYTAFFAAAIGLACSACSRSGTAPQTAARSAENAGISGGLPVPSGKPKHGGTVTVAVCNEIDSLDPYLAEAAGTSEILFNIFEGLFKYDAAGSVVPAAAESYTVSSDAKTYTFKIRENMKFHNGADVSVSDVIYSLKKAVDSKRASVFKNISAIRQDGNYVVIELKESDTDLLPFLTTDFTAVIPENYTESSVRPVGTGPFAFASYSVQQNVVLEKFAEYRDADSVYLDKVIFKLYNNPDAAYMDLLAGGIDLFPNMDTTHFGELKDSFVLIPGYRNIVQMLALNNAAAPFDDARVRQAVNYAVDVDQIIEVVSNGYGTKIGSAVIPGFKKYFNEALCDNYRADTEKAKALLTEAGYPDGFSFTIRVPSNYGFHVYTAELAAAQLAEAGITAKIEKIEWGVWLSEVYRQRKYEGTIVGISGELSPRRWLSRYVSGDAKNFLNFSNAEYDALYASADTETNDAESVKKYRELQKILNDDAAAVFIQDPQFLNVMKPNIAGYYPYPLYVQDLSTVYYTEN